ncbi:MAG: heme lyase CcmF/NrfE family subunit [Gammaproteobacteria bacterium]|nr:heme lyase CcmF/NrfE family subunit [Gammaproteobacteria bacterium]
MLPELGQICLALALCLALAQCVLPLAGAQLDRPAWMAVAVPAASGQFVFVATAFGLLTWSFLQNDFSVLYVATHSNTQLPTLYKVAAVWGGHEGSLLLWALTLCLWTVALMVVTRSLPAETNARVLGVMGLISAGFLMFILLTSNPFLRLDPIPIDGNDLNPLLQDPAMALHPPMLYIGYVGFSVAFAFAVAAMLSGRIDQQWARLARPWTTSAWVFLTLGIALGSWWAYYELGWGGWWFWDPVENASFMPWLVGTALIHSLAVSEKRGLFKGATLLLAIAAFSLSLLGTFLVRSGVLVSVHAFASDPTRGLFILTFLGLVIGGALLLYAWRAPALDRAVGFQPLSRETFLLINNILLSIAAGLVLFGTIAPLISEGMNLGKISVGQPYFEIAFLFPMLPLLLAVGVGMHTAWRTTSGDSLWRKLRWPGLAAVVGGVVLPWLVYGSQSVLTAIGVAAGLWLVAASLLDPVRRFFGRGPRLTHGMVGMQLAHLGLGLFVLGVTVTSSYNVETDLKIKPGETVDVAGYQVRFKQLREVQGPNYSAIQGEMEVLRDGEPVSMLYPEKRIYRVQRSPMTEAGIDARWSRDVFVALGDDLGLNTWSVRIQYKPLIRFIWFGCIVMAIGGIVAVSDPRYRRARQAAAVGAESSAT